MKLLSAEFIRNYPDFPAHMNALGQFVYYRTYSRFLPAERRRETWRATCARATEYNVGLAIDHLTAQGLPIDEPQLRAEAETYFDNMFNLRQFLSGRTLWVGGADGGVADKYPLANFNCSFLSIRSWDDFGDLFYLLMVGTGVGFKSTKAMADAMKPIRNDIRVIHEPYVQRYPLVKEANTSQFIINDGKKAVLHVGDSKEGWVDALRHYFRLMTEDEYAEIEEIGVFYDYVRPKGARLNTFGGTASGPEPLREMFEGIAQVVRNEIDPSLAPLEQVGPNRVKLRPVHMLDIGNLIGNNVVVGGVRRTAEIFLFDHDDYESMLAKYGINGIWDADQHAKVVAAFEANGLEEQAAFLRSLPVADANARPLHHRRMSNNSVAFTEQPPKVFLDLVFELMQAEGEPGFINLREAAVRRLLGRGITEPTAQQIEAEMVAIGLNPCAEILLDSYGVCNLTTVNLVQFVKNGVLDTDGLFEAQRMSARAGLRMTLTQLEIPHWNSVQQRDRLLGTSLTGVKDAMALLGYDEYSESLLIAQLGEISRREADRYAKELRVNAPLLVTTVKPEGTISQVANGVSSGLHYSHAPYYIRRIRINAADPLAKAIADIGWSIHAEVGTAGYQDEADLAKPEVIAQARTLVVDFPVASGAAKTKDDVYAREQFDTYFRFQDLYTEHNSSNTIHVRPDEWKEVSDIVYENWANFVGVSFLAYDGGSYKLAPYEAISKERYEEMAAGFAKFDPAVLTQYETGDDSDLEGMDGCEGGVCPIR